MVMPTVPRETLPLQDLVWCDYFRTPVIFEGSDIYRFVGEIQTFHHDKNVIISKYRLNVLMFDKPVRMAFSITHACRKGEIFR